MVSNDNNSSRRHFLKATGAGGLAITGGLSGCLGSITGSGDTVTVVSIPEGVGPPSLHSKLLADNLGDAFSDLDADVEHEFTWDAPTLLASDETDVAAGGIGALEAGTLGSERDVQLTVSGRLQAVSGTVYLNPGSEYAREETGGLQESLAKLAEDDARFGIPGWHSGAIPPLKLIMAEYGFEFSESGGDFTNVVTADFGASATQVKNEELAAGVTTAGSGEAPSLLIEDPPGLYELVHLGQALSDQGLGIAHFDNVVSRTSFAEEDTEILEAVLDAAQMAMDEMVDDAIDTATREENMEFMGVDTEDEAEFVITYYLNAVMDNEHAPDVPMMYPDVGLDDEWIEANRGYLGRVSELTNPDLLPSDWEDHVSYYKRS